MSVPREKIPWYPTIDEQLCTNCGVCVDFCTHGVYAVEDIRTVVTAPYSCIVGCSGCESQCAAGAIKFPEMEQFLHTLRELRVQFGQ
jgi:NAD-dependent dihydropyrimidine dehydrogenase PreA subunit